jgi:hypothetical protein
MFKALGIVFLVGIYSILLAFLSPAIILSWKGER